MTRSPAHSGTFYPGDPEELRDLIGLHLPLESMCEEMRGLKAESVGGIIAPHSPYVESIRVYAKGYQSMFCGFKGDKLIILGPDHTGFCERICLSSEEEWMTPLGPITVDLETSRIIEGAVSDAVFDDRPHVYDHSVEVQLPIIRYLYGERVDIVPVLVNDENPGGGIAVARAFYELASSYSRGLALISTANLSTYRSGDDGFGAVNRVVELIERAAVEDIISGWEDGTLPVCGLTPIVAFMELSRLKGWRLKLLELATSYELYGVQDNIVGYAAIAGVS